MSMILSITCSCSKFQTNSNPISLISSNPHLTSSLTTKINQKSKKINIFNDNISITKRRAKAGIVYGFVPVDPWSPNIDTQSIASQLFAFSLFPYLGFLYYLTKSKSVPKLTLFGFYFLLAFVGATIPAGIYAKVHYGTSLSNVDWLHGGAESLLTLSNLFVVLGLRNALRTPADLKEEKSNTISGFKEDSSSP